MSTPLVSICIPTYNGAAFIAEALESALVQTYTHLEIVVSDDASDDNTLKIVATVSAKTKIPIHIFNHTPRGIGANWNYCVKNSRGKYIKFLFQDDVLKPNCIENMVALAEANKQIGMVYCKRDFIFDNQEAYSVNWIKSLGVLHNSWKTIKTSHGVLPGSAYLKDANLLKAPKNKFGEPTAVLINKAVFNKIGYFNETLKQTLDIEFWWRILSCFDVGFVDEPLIFFRLHNQQASQKNENNKVNELQQLALFCYKNLFWKLHPNVRWYLFKNFSKLSKIYRSIKW